MSLKNAFKSLAFRVYMRPAPKTQSESNAVLRILQDFGPVSAFQIQRPCLNQDKNESQDNAVGNLVFAHNTKALDGIRAGKTSDNFSVTANANIPDPKVEDPFNVRGLQSRKPALRAQEIQCTIVPLEHHHEDEVTSILDRVKNNEFADTFAVDRSSIFGEILAKTDCPGGLIHGLLPKIADRHRNRVYLPTSTPADDDRRMRQDQGLISQVSPAPKVGRGAKLVHLRLDNHRYPDDSHAVGEGDEEMAVQRDGSNTDNVYDEFEHLRDVSLMQMYRKATNDTKPQQ